MTSRRLAGLGGLALAAADRSHGRQAPLLDLWRLSTPQIHPTKLGFDADQFIFSRTSPSSWHTVRAHASPFRALLACTMLAAQAKQFWTEETHKALCDAIEASLAEATTYKMLLTCS